jgi:hypothetical protein
LQDFSMINGTEVVIIDTTVHNAYNWNIYI